MIRVAAPSLLTALLVTGAASPASRTRCPGDTGFAQLAYVRNGALLVLDTPACSGGVLVSRGARGPVRWSADGRYVSFGSGVVSADGRRVFRGLHGVWAPRGHVLATLTRSGGVVVGGPGLAERQVVPEGFGAHSVAFDPAGTRIAVARAHPRATTPPSDRELWIVDTASGARRLVYRPASRNPRTPVVVRWGPGDFVLFRLALLPANSVNLDGLPLLAVPARGGPARTVLDSTLTYDEFYARCAGRIAISAGRDRIATRGKRILLAGPPSWRARDISRDHARSWISPACSPNGRRIAASAGRNWLQPRFGLERRSIWLLSVDGRTRRRLTAPPPGRSDELPRWTAGGRAVFFVRSGPTSRNAVARGTLYVAGVNGRVERLVDLGTAANYYGRYGWAEQTDLYLARGSQSASR